MIRGYYSDLTSPPTLVPFPVAEEWDSNDKKKKVENVALQAQRGRKFVQQQFQAGALELKFRGITEEQLQFFSDLHDEMGGDASEFYLVLDIDGFPVETLLGRKEKEFDHECIGGWNSTGEIARHYNYTLFFTAEVDSPISIEA